MSKLKIQNTLLLVIVSCVLIIAQGCGGINVANSPSSSPSTDNSTATTYSISGTITGSAQEGVTLSLSGGTSKTTTSSSIGTYAFEGLSNEAYIITPSLSGYSFTPTSQTATIEGSNITGKDFISSINTTGSGDWIHVTSGINTVLFSVKFVSSTTGFAVGENGIILKTTDGGTSWTKENEISGETFNDIDAEPNGTLHVVGNEGKIYINIADNDRTWEVEASLPHSNLFGIHFFGTTGWTVGDDGTIQKIQWGGGWQKLTSGTTKSLRAVKFWDANTGYAVGENGTMLKTIDGGANWTSLSNSNRGNIYGIFLLSSSRIFTVGETGTIHESTDGGSFWGAKGDIASSDLKDVYFTSSDEGWVVGNNGTILKTQDGGRSWTKQTIQSTKDLNAITFYGNTGFVVGIDGTILKYTE